MYKNRIISERLVKLAQNFPVVVLSGARQVGKSTALKHIFPDVRSVVLDPVSDIGGAKADPDLFLENNPSPLILDEIQYAPSLTAAIKRKVDANGQRPFQYILTGSQQWAVMKNLSESLAGRAVFMDLGGFSLSEIACDPRPANSWLKRWLESPEEYAQSPNPRLNHDRSLYEQLWRGFLPKADSLDLEFIQQYYRGYMQTYLERDVRMVSNVEDTGEIGKFACLCSALTAQEINHSQLGRDISITPQTAKRWLGLLRGTFQWFELPAYSGNTVKKISGKPKGYFADTGLACALNMITSHHVLGGHPLTGALFETAVAGEIMKLAAPLAPMGMYHWRKHSSYEVDMLLERDGIIYPIEMKLTSNPRKKDTSGITGFRKTYPSLNIAPGLVICPCERFMKISENDYALPWDSA